MKKIIQISIFLLIPIISFSQNTESQIKNVNEFAIIATNGIYEGFEKLETGYFGYMDDYRLPTKYNRKTSEYSYYYNTNDFKDYISREEPKYFDNLSKYKNSSASTKSMYKNEYEKELNIIRKNFSKKGKIPFRRIILENYVQALGNYQYSPITSNLKLTFNRSGYEQRNYNFTLTDWNNNLKRYNLLKEIENVKAINNIDEKVVLNQDLTKELNQLDYYSNNIKILDEKLMTIAEYDKNILKMQKDYPGKFNNKQRLQTSRDNHIKKLELKKELEKAKSYGQLDDLNFKLSRIYILLSILSNDVYEDNNLNQWYLIQPKKIIPYVPIDKKLTPLEPINLIIKNTKPLKKSNEQQKTVSSDVKTYIITVDNLRVRTSPFLDSDKIENLKIGNKVIFLEKSTNQTTVTIDNNEITEYWYKVRTPNGNTGWIHGCCFNK